MGTFLGGVTGFSLAVPLDRAAPAFLILAQTVTFSILYLLFFVLQKHGGPVYLSLLGSVAAIVGVPIAVFLLGEDPPQGLAISGVLIACGVSLLTLGGPKGDTETNMRLVSKSETKRSAKNRFRGSDFVVCENCGVTNNSSYTYCQECSEPLNDSSEIFFYPFETVAER